MFRISPIKDTNITWLDTSFREDNDGWRNGAYVSLVITCPVIQGLLHEGQDIASLTFWTTVQNHDEAKNRTRLLQESRRYHTNAGLGVVRRGRLSDCVAAIDMAQVQHKKHLEALEKYSKFYKQVKRVRIDSVYTTVPMPDAISTMNRLPTIVDHTKPVVALSSLFEMTWE